MTVKIKQKRTASWILGCRRDIGKLGEGIANGSTALTTSGGLRRTVGSWE